MTSGQSSGHYINRHYVEPRDTLYVPREQSFPMPLRYIDGTRATSTTLDLMLEAAWTIIGTSKTTEIYQIRGKVSHDSQRWMKNLQTDMHGPGSG